MKKFVLDKSGVNEALALISDGRVSDYFEFMTSENSFMLLSVDAYKYSSSGTSNRFKLTQLVNSLLETC